MLITLHLINTSRGGGNSHTKRTGVPIAPFRVLNPSNITEDNLLCNSMYFFVEKNFKPRPQHRIWVHLTGSFQNFRRAPRVFI